MMAFDKQPIEFYGELTSNLSELNSTSLFASQLCPFLNKTCLKQRKSNPDLTIGACTVGYRDSALIICPHRFLQNNQIFLDCIPLLQPNLQYFIVPEISMPGGYIDYFLIAKKGNDIIDYLGLEIQALDTTGSGEIWKAREDLINGKLSKTYGYGINWKMSAKTILVQMHHKAKTFEKLGKHLVLVLQKEFFEYITREFQTQKMRPSNPMDSIHFHIYSSVILESRLQIVIAEKKSTDAHGVKQMLNLGRKPGISEQEVINRIKAKMPKASPLIIPK